MPGESQGQRSLVGCRLWGCTESDTTDATQQQQQQQQQLVTTIILILSSNNILFSPNFHFPPNLHQRLFILILMSHTPKVSSFPLSAREHLLPQPHLQLLPWKLLEYTVVSLFSNFNLSLLVNSCLYPF